jgi:hypothetical protein
MNRLYVCYKVNGLMISDRPVESDFNTIGISQKKLFCIEGFV